MKKIFVILAMLLAFCFSATSVMAWSQTFGDSGVGNLNKFEVFMLTPGAGFEAPGFDSISVAGWSSELVNSAYILVTGPDANDFMFNILFSTSTPFDFDFLAWDNTNLIQRINIAWNGSGWNYQDLPLQFVDTYDRTSPSSAVPEPATLLLFGLGIAGLISLKKKEHFTGAV